MFIRKADLHCLADLSHRFFVPLNPSHGPVDPKSGPLGFLKSGRAPPSCYPVQLLTKKDACSDLLAAAQKILFGSQFLSSCFGAVPDAMERNATRLSAGRGFGQPTAVEPETGSGGGGAVRDCVGAWGLRGRRNSPASLARPCKLGL